MKKFFALLLTALFLVGCQPTPEEDAISRKNTNVLIQTIQTVEMTQADDAVPTPIPVKTQFPERFQCDFTTNGGARFTADVPIRVLCDGTFPVIRVERSNLSRDERILLVKRLLGSDTLYLHQQTVTLAYIESMIAESMRELTDEEKEAFLIDHTQEDLEEWVQSREESASYWQECYRSYNGDPQPYPKWDGSLPPGGDTIETTEYHIVCTSEPKPLNTYCHADVVSADRDEQIFYDAPWNEETGISHVHWFDNNASRPETGTERIAPEDYDRIHEGASVTASQAVGRVLPCFDGITELKVVDIFWSHNASADGDDRGKIGRWAYLIRMTPIFGNAYMPYCKATSTGGQIETDVMRPWRYEHVCAAVAGDGTLLSLIWESRLKVTEILTETAKLLPYDEILSSFQQNMNRRYPNSHFTGTVQDVTLGLFRIREQYSQDTGLLVPAWFITGEAVYESGEILSTWNESNPLCVINAIDGSIINPRIGY